MKPVRYLLALLLLSSVAPARAASAPPRDPLWPYAQFREKLVEVLRSRGLDPEHDALHFVVLMNVVRRDGPAFQDMRNVYWGLIRDYLVTSPEASDTVSFVPYRLWVADAAAIWERPFAPAEIGTKLYALPGSFPVEEKPGFRGGHDDEGAVIAAINRVTDRQKAVFIVLSDTEVSQPPDRSLDLGYRLTRDRVDFEAELSRAGIAEVQRGRFDGSGTDAAGQAVAVSVHYRFYLPTQLRPLGRLGQKSRSELIAEQAVTGPATPPGVTPPKPKPPIAPPRDGGPQEDSSVLAWVLGGVLAALALGTLGYLYWLKLPRNIQVEHLIGSVRHGTPKYVGGETTNANVLVLPQIEAEQRVAQLEVNPLGAIICRGYGQCSIFGEPGDTVRLGPVAKRVVFRDNQTDQIVHELVMKTVR